MIDVDHFKECNDCYGHPEATGAGAIGRQSVGLIGRPGDVAARYGGEEFAGLCRTRVPMAP